MAGDSADEGTALAEATTDPARPRRPRRRWRLALVALVVASGAVGVGLALTGGSKATAAQLLERILTTTDPEKAQAAARELAERLEPGPVRSLAAGATTDVRAQRGLDALVARLTEMLGEEPAAAEPATRARVVSLIGLVDTEATATTLIDTVGRDPDDAVAEAAADALLGMPQGAAGARRQLVAQRRELPADGSRARLLDPVIVGLGLPAVELLLPLVSDQPWALEAVAAIGPAAVAPLVARASEEPDGDDVAALRALKAISGREPEALAPVWGPLAAKLTDRYLDDPLNPVFTVVGAPIVPALWAIAKQSQFDTDSEGQSRIANAEFHLARLAAADREARAALELIIDQAETAEIINATRLIIRLGRPGSEQVLIDKLMTLRFSDRRSSSMVFDFYDSGNDVLVEGARAWARSRSLTITGTPRVPGIWGEAGAYR